MFFGVFIFPNDYWSVLINVGSWE